MKIKTQDYNNVTVVQLQGDLDYDSADMLKETIADIITPPKKSANKNNPAGRKAGIVLDFNAVGFIDSAGLAELLRSKDFCGRNNCQLRLAGLDENCRKILEITRLDNEFDCCAELAEAVNSFA